MRFPLDAITAPHSTVSPPYQPARSHYLSMHHCIYERTERGLIVIVRLCDCDMDQRRPFNALRRICAAQLTSLRWILARRAASMHMGRRPVATPLPWSQIAFRRYLVSHYLIKQSSISCRMREGGAAPASGFELGGFIVLIAILRRELGRVVLYVPCFDAA